MNIIEVKNNLVKLCYENDLKLSELIKISDNNKSFIAQILHLESTRIGKTAIAKLIFNYNNGISAYDGSIPSLKAEIETIDTSILLKIIDKDNPLNLGKLAQQENNLIVNIDILKDNPIICAEKYFTTKVLLNNIAMQLQARKSKIVVFDTVGVFKSNKITLTKDFRLPLNSSTINYIYEKGFEDATAESKALIQSIFEELSEYSKTVEYIPFDTFKAVIDAEFKRTQLMQLIILKNKIKQIRDWNVFAEKEADFKALKLQIENNQTTVIDISGVKDELQKECIKYIYSILNNLNEELYVFVPVTNENSDKQLLQQINDSDFVHTTTICGYDYKYMQELKQRSKNMLMFTPLKQQDDFGGYNIFLKKLAEDEFIAYGKMTKFVPLIAKLHALSQSEIFIPKELYEVKPETEKTETTVSTDEITTEITPEETELLQTQNEKIIEDEIAPSDKPIEAENIEQVIETEEIQTFEQADVQNGVEDTINESAETTEPEAKTQTEIQDESTKEESQPTVEEALSQVEETVDEEELSDDDLDMIEQLSKPDEEIEILNQESDIANENNIVNEDQVEEVLEQENIKIDEESVKTIEPVSEATEIIEENELSETTEKDEIAQNLEVNTITENTTEEIAEKVTEEATDEQTNSTAQPEEQSAESVDTELPSDVDEKKTKNEVIEEENRIDNVDEEINSATIPGNDPDIQTRTNKTPLVPEYSSEIPDEDKINDEKYKEGDRVMHQEFGEGVVEKMINYGDKILCSINFASVGRRLLNPEITEMTKI